MSAGPLLQVRVEGRSSEAEDIAGFTLVSVDGAALPPFTAGAHIDVHIRPGLIRQYSLCNAPHETHRYQIGVLRDPNSRGGSLAVHDSLQVGALLHISAPKNHFALTPAKRTLLLAGGIGVTPLLSMAEQLASSGVEFAMHYCARSPQRTAFRERIAASAFADCVSYHFDSGDDAQKLNLPQLLAAPDAHTHLYVCGPGGFIDHVMQTAKQCGWPAAQLHLEYFGGAPLATDGDQAFDVKLASSGKVICIPAGVTVIKALAEHGIDIQVACEQGVCGTCLTRVIDGEPDHRDVYLTDDERAANDMFTPCCSRAKSAVLVLDL